MFIGHYALAFAAKKTAPTMSLGTAFLACQFADLLWPTLVMLGIEKVEVDPGNTLVTPLNFVSYPYSHSFVMLLVWSGLIALIYRAIRGWNGAAIATVGALVFSHYVLDVITHRPDMPITIHGSRRLGLGLWNHPEPALAIELAMFLAGMAIYARMTRPKDKAGHIGYLLLVAFLSAIYFAALYGPPPPSAAAVAGAGQASWLFVIWASWLDRHRVTIDA